MSESHLRFMERTRPDGLDKEAVRWALAEIEKLRDQMTPEPIMTDPSVSEAEVEAAARAVYERYLTAYGIAGALTWEQLGKHDKASDLADARAALTAAAQVRGREDESDVYACLAYAKLQKAEIERLQSALEQVRDTAYSPRDDDTIWMDDQTPLGQFIDSHISRNPTEPDSGPDVLGISKGEE